MANKTNISFLRGSSTQNFVAKPYKKSRYGFPALFCATERRLAVLYAIHRKEETKKNEGFIHNININIKPHVVSFHHKESYCNDFRNLIYQLRNEGHSAVLITNIFDFPSRKLMIHNRSDVLVIFDFSIITSIDLVESGINKIRQIHGE